MRLLCWIKCGHLFLFLTLMAACAGCTAAPQTPVAPSPTPAALPVSPVTIAPQTPAASSSTPAEAPQVAVTLATLSAQGEQGLNLLVQPGRIEVLRGGKRLLISLGAEIQRGELLYLETGQQAKILCADLSPEVLDRDGQCRCSDTNTLFYSGYKVRRTMGVEKSVPRILSPRQTNILSPQPILKWQDTGARSYTVEIHAEGKEFWTLSNVKQTEVKYPGVPALEPGVHYQLIVTDDSSGASSSADAVKGLSFELLNDEARGAVESGRDKIRGLDLSAEAEGFAVAVYYATQGVSGEALSLLDGIAGQLRTPAVQLWRGHVLAEMALTEEATEAYKESLALAEASGEVYAQAEAKAGLWCVTGIRTYGAEALQLYTTLGEAQPRFICGKTP